MMTSIPAEYAFMATSITGNYGPAMVLTEKIFKPHDRYTIDRCIFSTEMSDRDWKNVSIVYVAYRIVQEHPRDRSEWTPADAMTLRSNFERWFAYNRAHTMPEDAIAASLPQRPMADYINDVDGVESEEHAYQCGDIFFHEERSADYVRTRSIDKDTITDTPAKRQRQ